MSSFHLYKFTIKLKPFMYENYAPVPWSIWECEVATTDSSTTSILLKPAAKACSPTSPKASTTKIQEAEEKKR